MRKTSYYSYWQAKQTTFSKSKILSSKGLVRYLLSRIRIAATMTSINNFIA